MSVSIALWIALFVAALNPSPWSTQVSTLLHPSSWSRPQQQLTSVLPQPVQGCQDVKRVSKLEPREQAAIVSLVREKDLDELVETLHNFEQRFNKWFRYPYVMIASPDEGHLSLKFRQTIEQALPSEAIVEYSVVRDQDWKIPDWMEEQQVRMGFEKQEKQGVMYAGREGYHHMCRFFSGLWVRNEALLKYNWTWRLEPGVRFHCDITYDPFRFMAANSKVYGFVITIVENMNTIPTLFKSVMDYVGSRALKPESALWRFMVERKEREGQEEFNGCHFWTNFEIADLRFFRSAEYQEFFRHLDEAGGFYAERWGDAPVRALGLALLTSMDRIHYFEDFAYQHDWFMHCPKPKGLGCNCQCPAYSKDPLPKNELTDVDTDWRFSCLHRWKDAVTMALA
ncbi:hypothetical protein OIO90_001916 [Microbotryomycetes sp. JL221]|nr:hypothetical protein OIO90_001916 [Microbotryomycetes sp. JL221]